jgi:hypothetical protein
MPETVSSAPGIDRLRYPDEHLGWLVTDFGLGRKILRDPRFSQRPLRFGSDGRHRMIGATSIVTIPRRCGQRMSIDHRCSVD